MPRSILMAEKTAIKLYSEERFQGDYFEAQNHFAVEEGQKNCVCVKLTDQDGHAFPIHSFSYENHNNN